MAAAKKPKCQYWDKCFRASAAHKKQYRHPCDEDEEDKVNGDTAGAAATPAPAAGPSKPQKLVKMGVIKSGDDDEEEDMDTTPAKKAKTPMKRKAHTMSQSDGEEDEEETKPSASPAKKLKTNSEEKKSEDADASPVKKVRMKCKYWDECYQKSKAHLKQFIHPGDYDAPEEPAEAKKTRSKDKKPLNEMEDGESVDIDTYRIKRTGDSYYCNCQGWKMQKGAPDARTCKHLKEYLGEEFENQRTGAGKPQKKAYIPGHITVNVLLAQKYDKSVNNPVGWWMSEKLDGVRAFWNGRCFYSRLGNAFIAPDWFTKDLPTDMQMDGELFGGRGKFQSTVSIVKTPGDERWKSVKYHVFDCPNLEKQPFEKRYEELTSYFEKAKPKYALLCEQTKCTGQKQLDEDLKKVLELGGEGLMLRQPKSQYERRRSPTLLKIKKFHDAEAVVIGHEPGKGRYQHCTGSLRCRMECGKEFSVGSGMTDADRRKPPKIGSIITYRFQEYSNSGSPRFPTFVGIRIDADGPKDVILPKKPE